MVSDENKDGVEIKSRDIGVASGPATPSKRKSKKKLESQSSSSSAAAAETLKAAGTAAERPAAMNVKLILGVALISIIVGIVLGKKY